MSITEEYLRWKKHVPADTALSNELYEIEYDFVAIEDRFYRELEFGTGGLRGVLGVGTNRMNVYTVAKATQGYANYLLRNHKDPSVAIAYDSRIGSELFSKTAAAVFAANGVHVYLYSRLMPTPCLSFAVRELHCSGGVVITASHNPAQYNGYKVYGSDGCQMTKAAAKAIQKEIGAVDIFRDVRSSNFDMALCSGKISYIPDEIVKRYLRAVSATSILPEDISRDISIVYTPLNGTGISCIPQCLKEHGFTRIVIPTEQEMPDGNFPTCPFPNPEISEALSVGLSWAKRLESDLLLATDPDCDRVGAAVRHGNDYALINGNEMGVLLLDFICKMRTKQGTMPMSPIAIKTIVTTPMADRIAEHYGVELAEVLTGFKFIGEQIGLLEQKGQLERYLFGFEESYGYLSGSYVRDKDAVNAVLLICEMCTWYKAHGKSLKEVLDELYQAYGFYQSGLLSFVFDGRAGFEKMQAMMQDLRETPPREIAGLRLEAIGDYSSSVIRKLNGGEKAIHLPKSNVIRYYLQGGSEVAVRPSGTEPKLKVYFTAVKAGKTECAALVTRLKIDLGQWVKS